MSDKDQLIRELDQAPDFLVREVLNFLLFIKTRTNQIPNQEPIKKTKESNIPDFLSFIDQVNSEIPTETNIPKDLAKNLDHYLYGSPKEFEAWKKYLQIQAIGLPYSTPTMTYIKKPDKYQLP